MTCKRKLFALQFITLISIVFFLFSCKKDKHDEILFPRDLSIISIQKKTEVRVFSNKQEVTNEVIKTRFAADEVFSYGSQTITVESKLSFSSKDSVSFGNQQFSVVQNGDLFLFHAVDGYIEVNLNNPYYKMIKYKNPLLPVASGPNFMTYFTNEVKVAHGNFNKMELSVLCYVFKQGNPSSSWSKSTGTLFNEFDQESISSLGVNDTLAVQEFVINLAR